ncbi:GNAT family N-acetyltransferase [Sphingosinicella sp. LHD-64]|uniref:GNAT family N-acetyltransferase n=1 Tax=Sphingosinicella sp. LHD-64 TaxID=3072139 RepID=UPI00280E8C6C|nr:GNAT family N-acetyltransferase [Sphingosinicella sp. LHD-64]MDQ8757870.1 GNAT family N-acetyltransferase [Sphingosinicella sp. LHD-64]
MIEIAPLAPADRADWEMLARGYKAFYNDPLPDEDYVRTWQLLMAGDKVHGLGARIDGRTVGITHYLFHPHIWKGEVCYLQDLFTAPEVRGKGVARALIAAVAEAARTRGASACYWLTKEDNRAARALYDKVARFKGFLRYDYPF